MTAFRLSADQLRVRSDEDLIAAYEHTDGEPGDERTDALLAEIKHRGRDI